MICSGDDRKFARFSARIADICSAPHEIIRIRDAASLAEGYQRGAAAARHEVLVLCHDDIDLLCGEAFAAILYDSLQRHDVVGVAGAKELKTAFWLNGGAANRAGLVIQGPADQSQATFAIHEYDDSRAREIPVQALDGVFLAMHRKVLQTVQFDADTFDGFHLYDIDFSYRCHLEGLRLGVCKDFLLVQSSAGDFGDEWQRYEKRFQEKFPEFQSAPARFPAEDAWTVVPASSKADARAMCEQARGDGAPSLKELPARREDDRRYKLWRKRTSFQEIDAQLLAERMVLHWTQRPRFHFLMELAPGAEHLLADTLDALQAQLYPDWMLTVATILPAPEAAADVPGLQWLAVKQASDLGLVLDEVAAISGATWLGRIAPGLALEPQALQVMADYVNARPDWRLIYCDEDLRGADGSRMQPRFKPDFNLDLLRAQDYFGSLVLVEKQAFIAAGRFGSLAGAENYDLALRLLDQVGEGAIGHVSQVLASSPAEPAQARRPDSERAALLAHCERRGLSVRVFDGAAPGLRMLRYEWDTAPLVSLVIQTTDREEYLAPLLESLQQRTAYPRYEVVLVDNDSRDPDALRYLDSLEAAPAWQGRIQRVSVPGAFSYAAGANAGAAAAAGQYLLFLDNDTHIVQDEWLDVLMGIAQRPEVAIVAPRLNYPETARVQQVGWITGLRGIASSPWDDNLDPTEPGYMGRALSEQNVSAVSGSALLIRKSVFDQLNGVDSRFAVHLGMFDLCMRAGERGCKLVWTPHSMLVHYGGVSMKAQHRKPEHALANLLDWKKASDAILERWLPQLAHDPAYNRNLSLIEPYKPEHVASIDWDPNFRDRTRILAVPVTGGAGEYRLRAPLRAIGKAGLAQTMVCESPKAFQVRILTPAEVARAAPDVLVLHQPLGDTFIDALESYARHLPGIRRIITVDDLMSAIPRKSSAYKNGFKDGRARMRRALALADRLVVSTQPLAEFCADMVDDIRVMPNCLEGALWNGVTPPGRARSRPRVGWAGAQQHLGDLELVYPVVEALADEVDWVFMGMCPEPLKPYVKEYHEFELDFRLYPAALAQLDLDLAIAPLELNAFNEAKSNLRLLEYGFMGWPVICTDIAPYRNAPVTRLPNDPQRWIATIREQLAEPDALKAAGHALQGWVREGFMLENHVAGWFAAYGG
ncbi:glycosyltransferase [Xylophilus sp. ASV27]|uniref:glycosyltransferase n=1 Tax=Xylophilus sp. ASV27 TaxID=2795129 RepID=UPI0018EBC004|nr:glycosyltransferase [Xylophilus sp. ASV27]